MWTEILSLFAVLIATYFWSERHHYQKQYPPGPWGIPILGNLLQIGNSPFKTFMNWKSKYGSVVLVYFGSFRTVGISDYKLVKQALSEYDFAGRPHLQPFLDRSGGKLRGVLFGEGKSWTEQRRFTVKHLNDLGFGSHSRMESVIQQETALLLEDMVKLSGIPISMKHRFNIVSLNVIWKLIAGDRFESDDANLLRILKIINANLDENNGIAELGMFIPWITKRFPNLFGYNRIMKDMQALLDFIDVPIKYHKETHQDLQPRDFLDTYIDEIKKTTDPESSFYKENGYKSMSTVLLDLFTAGGETTSTVLSWFCLYVTVNPDVQEKLHKEIMTVIGSSRSPNLSDKPLLPYLDATIYETLRITSVVPIALFHKTFSDTKCGDYVIPKDTMIIPNLYACHHDREYWIDPGKFRPERFLSIDGKTIVKHEAFMPFSTGKRLCPGENLAYLEIYFILATVLQNFHITTDQNNPNPSLNPNVSFVLTPKPHKLVFTKKSHN